MAIWKKDALRIGFTSGVFDLLHAGHVDYLEKARAQCDRLVVALNNDYSVRHNKGPSRPIQAHDLRARVLASLKMVDAVFIFSEYNNNENIRILQPDLYIKAGDYDKSKLSSAPLVEAYGGKVELIPVRHDVSTSGIIEDILSRNCSYAKFPVEKPRPVIFLDRDGVINEEIEYLHEPDKFKLTKNCLEGLELLSTSGYALVIVTNQAGIGLGYFDHEDFYKINRVFFRHLKNTKIMLDKIYYCPHAFSVQCDCRKPSTGMFERAFVDLNLTKQNSYMIGDRETDIEAGQKFGLKSLLMTPATVQSKAEHQVPDLLAAAKWIVGQGRAL